MGQLRLTLLGRFEARLNSGERVDIPGTKAAALLACLALEDDGSLPRAKLLHLLWSDRSESQARASLRQLLWALRKSLQSVDPPSLVINDESVTLLPELVNIDVLEFQRLVKSDLPKDLATAANLYKGELLEDLIVRDAVLEERLFYERERLQKLALDALQRLLQHQEKAEQVDEAVDTAQQILSIDPLQESAHRHLIRHFLQVGHTGLAVEQFKRCRDTFRRELGIEPSDETARLLQEVAIGTGEGPANTATVGVRPKRAFKVWPSRISYPIAIFVGAAVIGAGLAVWLKPWEPVPTLSSTQFPTDTGGRGWGRQGVKAGRLNLKLDLPTRWDAQIVEEEQLSLQGFETDRTNVQYEFARKLDGTINPQVVVATDREDAAHFRIFKWYKFIPTAKQEDAHKWMQERGIKLILDRYTGGGLYEETRGAIEKGTLGSGEELTMIPSVLRVNEETRYVWIAYVSRGKDNIREFIVFFFHNGARTAEISKDLVLEVTASATKMFR